MKATRRRRRRAWHLSPEGFRALRHSCFLTPEACAQYLGVSLRTVRHWDAGRCRVPWSAVRLLRLRRLGDLGALQPAWAGWTLNRNGLWSPDGKQHRPDMMTAWWLVCEQARFWRDDYDRRTLGGVGAQAPARPQAVTLQPEAAEAISHIEIPGHIPPSVVVQLTALLTSISIGRESPRERSERGDSLGLVFNATSGTPFGTNGLLVRFVPDRHGAIMGPEWGHILSGAIHARDSEIELAVASRPEGGGLGGGGSDGSQLERFCGPGGEELGRLSGGQARQVSADHARSGPCSGFCGGSTGGGLAVVDGEGGSESALPLR